LETVYEALEAGGHTLEGLRGSDTSVYVGTMSKYTNHTAPWQTVVMLWS
jgi:hybrid polyketide synthase/nonribosomal peptide synthetase ACE1